MSLRLYRSVLMLAVAYLSPSAVAAQGLVCQLGGGPSTYNPAWDQPPTAYAINELQTIEKLLCPTGCGAVVLALNNSAMNALTLSNGVSSKIVYNPMFMGQVYAMIGPEATFGILAHEFGHHIDLRSTPTWMNSSWAAELKADAWAGCALAKRGFAANQIAVALQAISAFPSASHPSWQYRIPAVQTGYLACGGQAALLPWAR
jgi:hypothetical protein